jgi:hypothetical protein
MYGIYRDKFSRIAWVMMVVNMLRPSSSVNESVFITDILSRNVINYLFDNYEYLHYFDPTEAVDEVRAKLLND